VSGPLEGIRVVELAGIGPGPYTCMLLADAGADVLRVDRGTGSPPAPSAGPHWDLLNRSRRSVAVNLKDAEGVRLVLDLIAQADGLVEGWRPGVAERLGVGPEVCMERNPRLVYGRMTGWGQDGPLASAAGHDINYIALAGALWPIGRVGERPVPPLNLVGDFGGGGMLLAFGMCAAMLEAQRSGQGQVVDAAMVDGAASLLTMTFAFRQLGLWTEGRGVNVLDTGAPFYEVYDTSDGKWFSVGAIEPQFYAELLKVLGLDAEELPAQNDRTHWPATKERFAAIFRTRSRDEWTEAFAGRDACGAPVLSPWEAHTDPHNAQRQTFVEVEGVVQPGPVPRFSRTPAAVHNAASVAGADAVEALRSWGIDDARIATLRESGAVD
jgi:alpha-methylacyl-CoA racemase